jgi:hypothetical protein
VATATTYHLPPIIFGARASGDTYPLLIYLSTIYYMRGLGPVATAITYHLTPTTYVSTYLLFYYLRGKWRHLPPTIYYLLPVVPPCLLETTALAHTPPVVISGNAKH